MRYILAFLLISFSSFAQDLRPYLGFGVYYSTDFDKSTFVDVRTGVEYKIASFLRPEIEVSYTFGNLEDLPSVDNSGVVLSEYFKSVSAVNYSLCPKIILGAKDEDGASGYLQILPKYTYSRIEATGDKISRNPTNPSNSIKETEKAIEYRHSLGIGLGWVVDFSSNNYDSISFNIYFNNIDLGNALNMLHQERRFKTDDVLGFGVSYYFSFKKKK
ncbi:hypothetical protein [Flavobacterium sp.]|uniref:hypothetical protein n=1 Tax=Flavobacterium sp. TaxID=239 RepID=UPI0026160C93|nr:hypothetical protein [Flavobacterium sp.]